MTDRHPPDHSRLATSIEGWREFWFGREPAYTLGLVRIAFGALTIAWASALLPDLYQFFGEHAVVPVQLSNHAHWSVFQVWFSDEAILAAWVVLLLAAIALTVGWHSRVAAILVFVLIRSFMARNPWVFNSGDALMQIEALFLALCSNGAALSLDHRRQTGVYWSAQCRAVWPIRLLQVQLSLIYFAAAQAKLSGKSWLDGSAVSYVWQGEARWAVVAPPEWLTSNPLLVNAATWATVLVELSIAVPVWNRRLRMWVLLVGVVMHLLIMVNMAVGFFSPAMFVLYVAFVPWQTVERMPETIRAKWARVRRSRNVS